MADDDSEDILVDARIGPAIHDEAEVGHTVLMLQNMLFGVSEPGGHDNDTAGGREGFLVDGHK